MGGSRPLVSLGTFTGFFTGLFCLLACVLLSVSLLAPATSAVGIGVNKAVISYEDVLQNGYAQDEVLVTTDSEQPIVGTWQLEGEITPWVRIEPNDTAFTFSKNQPYQLTVIVEPPLDAQLRSYTGGIRILTGQLDRTEGGKIGTSTRAAFLIRLGLGVTGTQNLQCRAGGIQIKSTEIGQPFDLVASVANTGNVRISPDFVVEVYDQAQERLLKNVTIPGSQEILPTVTGEFLKRVAQDLPVGQYWARVSVPLCGDVALVTFDVLDRGTIADQGELVRIDAQPWAKTGDIIPIHAVFRNLGSRTVTAKFKGTVTTQPGGSIAKVIDTDTYNVPPGETAQIETFFNPTEPGQYVVAGRVLYNSKLTFQKSTILNVQGPFLKAASGYGWLVLIAIAIVILLLLILIRRKRRRGRHVILRR